MRYTYGILVCLPSGKKNEVLEIGSMMALHKNFSSRGEIYTEAFKTIALMLNQCSVGSILCVNIDNVAIPTRIAALDLFLPFKDQIDKLFDMGCTDIRFQSALVSTAEKLSGSTICVAQLSLPSLLNTEDAELARRDLLKIILDKNV